MPDTKDPQRDPKRTIVETKEDDGKVFARVEGAKGFTQVIPPAESDVNWAGLLGLTVTHDGVQGVQVTDTESGDQVYPDPDTSRTSGTRHNLSAFLLGFASGKVSEGGEYIGKPSRPTTSKAGLMKAENDRMAKLLKDVASGKIKVKDLAEQMEA